MGATSDRRVDLESGRHDAALALTTGTTTQISSANCLGPNCSTTTFVTLSKLDSSRDIPNLAPSGREAFSISNTGRFNGSPAGRITLQSGVDRTARTPSNVAFTFASGNQLAQLDRTTATITSGIGSPYLQGTHAGFGSFVRQLF